jgi:hypothetical protein
MCMSRPGMLQGSFCDSSNIKELILSPAQFQFYKVCNLFFLPRVLPFWIFPRTMSWVLGKTILFRVIPQISFLGTLIQMPLSVSLFYPFFSSRQTTVIISLLNLLRFWTPTPSVKMHIHFTSQSLIQYQCCRWGQHQIGDWFTELLGFWTLSIVRILIVTRKKKNKHDVSETGSVSVLRW